MCVRGWWGFMVSAHTQILDVRLNSVCEGDGGGSCV